MAASTKTDRSIGTVEIPHEGPEDCKFVFDSVSRLFLLKEMSSTHFIYLLNKIQICGKRYAPCGAIYI